MNYTILTGSDIYNVQKARSKEEDWHRASDIKCEKCNGYDVQCLSLGGFIYAEFKMRCSYCDNEWFCEQ